MQCLITGIHLVPLWQMKSGKHVYVEKPSSCTMQENELLVMAKKYNKVVQMGNQRTLI